MQVLRQGTVDVVGERRKGRDELTIESRLSVHAQPQLHSQIRVPTAQKARMSVEWARVSCRSGPDLTTTSVNTVSSGLHHIKHPRQDRVKNERMVYLF